MRFSAKDTTKADGVRKVALAALSTVLGDGKQEAPSKAGLTGVRAVATGAVLYTAGRAVVTGRRFILDRVGGEESEDEARDNEELEDEEFEEPEAEEDDEVEDEDYEEPEAEEDEEFEDDEVEEPEDEEDEDYSRPRRRSAA